MTTAYYILVVPEALKTLSAFSGIGLLITVSLYYSARLHKPALLTFHQDHISINGKEIDISISHKEIDKIFCNDLKNLFRKPKNKLQFVIRQKRRRSTTFMLKHYEQGEEFLEELSTLEKVGFAFYDDDMVGDHHDE